MSMLKLLDALEKQTEMINNLIESNTQLMAFLIEQQLGDEEVSKNYLDGTVCR